MYNLINHQNGLYRHLQASLFFSPYFVLRFKANYSNFAKQDSKFIVMKRIYLYLIIIVTCILSSCNLGGRGKGVLPKELMQAENIMYENPDSALQILQSMAIPVNKEAHATWALLLTQAKYKCFVDQSDSLINIAHDYFMKGDNAQRKALALYHKAILYKVRNQVDEALPYYLQASENIVLTKDYRLAYLIYSHIGMVYAYRNLHNYSVPFCEKANEYALLSNDSYYIVESYNCMARTYSAQKQYTKAIEFYDKAIEFGKIHNEAKLINSAIQEKMGIYIRQNNYKEAQKLVKTLNYQILSKAGCQIIGHLYQRINQVDSAYYYLNKAIESNNIYTQKTAYKILFNLSNNLKDYKKNAEYAMKLWEINDSINNIDRNKALIEIQAKYDQQKLINEKNKADKKGLIILCASIGIISIIVLCYQWKVLRQSRELKKKEKELTDFVNQLNENKKIITQNIIRIEELEGKEEISAEQQKENKESIIEMQKQNETLLNKNKNLQQKINEYIVTMAEKSKEIEGLRTLSEKNLYLHKRELFLCNELLKKEEFVNKIKKNPKPLDVIQWRDIMSKTDAIYDNYTIRLRTRIPQLTENDIRICCLIKLSFSNGDVAKILSISPTSVSRQKLRLKERIIQQVGSLGDNVLLDIWLKEF